MEGEGMKTTDLGLADRMGVRAKVNELPGRPTDFVIVGGAALAVRGLRPARNLNMIVGSRLWDSVAYGRGWTQRQWTAPASTVRMLVNDDSGIEMYRDLTIAGCPLTYDIAVRESELVAGMRVLLLPTLARWKRARWSVQDQADVGLIEQWRAG